MKLLVALLINLVGNIYILSTYPSFLIVPFNAAMIIILCAVDYSIAKAQKSQIEKEIGEGLVELYKLER